MKNSQEKTYSTAQIAIWIIAAFIGGVLVAMLLQQIKGKTMLSSAYQPPQTTSSEEAPETAYPTYQVGQTFTMNPTNSTTPVIVYIEGNGTTARIEYKRQTCVASWCGGKPVFIKINNGGSLKFNQGTPIAIPQINAKIERVVWNPDGTLTLRTFAQ